MNAADNSEKNHQAPPQPFGNSRYEARRHDAIGQALQEPLSAHEIMSRPGGGSRFIAC